MHAVWHFILYVLACWSHDPATLAAERARCAGAGAVAVAYAALAQLAAAAISGLLERTVKAEQH
jgi:hypothetical protein